MLKLAELVLTLERMFAKLGFYRSDVVANDKLTHLPYLFQALESFVASIWQLIHWFERVIQIAVLYRW